MLIYPKDIAETYFARRPVLSLAYLGTMLDNANHPVDLLDMRVKGHNMAFFKKRLREFKPELVGFSMVALSLDQAYEMMAILKKELPSAKVICGGPEVTLLPKKILAKDLVDFIISGEGEYSLLEFIDCLENKKDFSSIYGLGYKKGKELFHRPPKTINNLDKLPFPNYSLFNLKKYRSNISKIKWPIMTSRGCPYSCRFCDSIKVNLGYRVRSPKNIVDELEKLQKNFKAKQFQVLDDNFWHVYSNFFKERNVFFLYFIC